MRKLFASNGIFDKGNHPQLKDQNDNYSSPNSNAPSEEEEEEEEESSNFICVICHPHFWKLTSSPNPNAPYDCYWKKKNEKKIRR